MPGFTSLFLACFILTFGLRLWLALRQMRHVWLNRQAVPAAFADSITPQQHRRAADYTLAKTRLSIVHLALEATLLWAFTLGGGLQWLYEFIAGRVEGPLLQGTLLLLALAALLSAAELPLALWRQFRIEARFGFNRQSLAGFVADLIKQAGLGLAGDDLQQAGEQQHDHGEQGGRQTQSGPGVVTRLDEPGGAERGGR